MCLERRFRRQAGRGFDLLLLLVDVQRYSGVDTPLTYLSQPDARNSRKGPSASLQSLLAGRGRSPPIPSCLPQFALEDVIALVAYLPLEMQVALCSARLVS